ncbi:MAG: hypothetical protein U1B84_21310, partial [Variovorax sp.]|nr:hypothetical protein [Variovorax sp.]
MASSHAPLTIETPKGRILVFDSATYVEGYVAHAPGTAGDLVVNASYSGVLCARMVMSAKPRFVIGLDCAIGKDGAGVDVLAVAVALIRGDGTADPEIVGQW